MSVLLEPITIAGIKLPNRFVRSATYDGFSTPGGEITDGSVALVRELAKGGTGLIITGFAYVTCRGQAVPNQTAVYDDDFIPGLRRLARAVHEYEAKVVLQIGDCGSQSPIAIRKGYRPLAPSVLKKDWISYQGEQDVIHTDKGTPEHRMETTLMEAKGMSEDEINTVIDAHGQAARRAREAGFDGVQFHAGHGYLLSQFASPATNRRTDKWGGSLENRMRFGRACYAAARRTVGEDFPLFTKLGIKDQTGGGLSMGEGIRMAELLARDGMDSIEISEGVEEEPLHHIRTGVDRREREAYYLPWARRVREVVDIPLFLVGGLRSFDIMEQIVTEGVVDCVSMSRPFVRQPLLVQQFSDRGTDMVKCISCNGCLKILQKGPLKCVFNE